MASFVKICARKAVKKIAFIFCVHPETPRHFGSTEGFVEICQLRQTAQQLKLFLSLPIFNGAVKNSHMLVY